MSFSLRQMRRKNLIRTGSSGRTSATNHASTRETFDAMFERPAPPGSQPVSGVSVIPRPLTFRGHEHVPQLKSNGAEKTAKKWLVKERNNISGIKRRRARTRRRLSTDFGPELAAEAETDGSERAVETHCLRLAFVDARIHRAEEEISAITKADFGIGEIQRCSNKAAYVGDSNLASTIKHGSVRVLKWRSAVIPFINPCRLMATVRTLPPEQNSRVYSPIDAQELAVWISDDRHRRVPGYCWPDALELSIGMNSRCESMKSGRHRKTELEIMGRKNWRIVSCSS